MSKIESAEEFTQFIPHKLSIYIRGFFMLIVGSFISMGSIVAPDVHILSGSNAWLPIAALVLLVVGSLEFLDTYISRNTHRFIVNLQFAVMDTVFGAIILFGLSYGADKMSMLVAAFLLVKGLFRLISATAGRFPHAKSTIICGCISIFLGILLWIQWPSTSAAFLSFSLSLEIALRGWALVCFANWLGKIAKQNNDLKQP